MDSAQYISDTVHPERSISDLPSMVREWKDPANIAKLVERLSKDEKGARAFAGALYVSLSLMTANYMMERHSRENGSDSHSVLSLAMRLPLYSAELGLAGLYRKGRPLSSGGERIRERLDGWQAQYQALEEQVVGWFIARDKGLLGSLGTKIHSHRLTPRFVRRMIEAPVKKAIQSYDPMLLATTAMTRD